MTLAQVVHTFPTALVLAAAAYGLLLAVLASPFLRRKIGGRLAMPSPSNQAHLASLDAYRGLAAVYVAVAGRRGLPWAAGVFIVFCMGDVVNSRELSLWKYFAAGILASELHRNARNRLKEWGAIAIVAAGVALLAVDVQLAPGWLDRAIQRAAPWLRPVDLQAPYTVALAVATTLLLSGSACSRWAGVFFALTPWRVLAAISYSIFVWHSMIIVADAPVTFDGVGFLKPDGGFIAGAPGWVIPFIYLPAYILVGSLSFLAIERPFLLLRSRLWPKHAVPRAVAADYGDDAPSDATRGHTRLGRAVRSD